MVDVFTQLSQCFDVVSKLECPDPEIWKRYMRRFAKTVVKVLLSYVEIVKADYPEQMKNESIVRAQTFAKFKCFHDYLLQACVLMNNIQQLRIQLEKMFESMGGEKLEEDAANILKDLQQQLNNILDELALQFANRYVSSFSCNPENCHECFRFSQLFPIPVSSLAYLKACESLANVFSA